MRWMMLGCHMGKKMASQIRIMVAGYIAYHAHENEMTGKWLRENFFPGSYGYELGDVRLAIGELYNELSLAINPVSEDLVTEGK